MKALGTDPAAFVAVIVKVNSPVAVVDPDKTPVPEFKLKPVGRVPEVTENDEFAGAVSV